MDGWELISGWLGGRLRIVIRVGFGLVSGWLRLSDEEEESAHGRYCSLDLVARIPGLIILLITAVTYIRPLRETSRVRRPVMSGSSGP